MPDIQSRQTKRKYTHEEEKNQAIKITPEMT